MPWLRRNGLRILLVLLVLVLGAAWLTAREVARMTTGFFAKNLCSAVHVSGRDAAEVVRADLLVYQPRFLFALVTWGADEANARVTASLPGLATSSARFVPGKGCRRERAGEAPAAGGSAPVVAVVRPGSPPPAISAPWPEGDVVDTSGRGAALGARLDAALEAAFVDRDPQRQARTRAVIVVHKGRILAERYANGITAHTPLPGWSMAKSVTAAMLGTLVARNLVKVDESIGLKAWPADDPRHPIRWRDALTMTTGLEFSEAYGNPFSDVNRMLFVLDDAPAAAASKPIAHPPGTFFSYSSGTTNLISVAMRERLGAEYDKLPAAFFASVGMRSAVLETDPSGNYVGSSFLYATARDWARFGLLYLRNGVRGEQRVLAEEWIRLARKPAGPVGYYGAHWWLGEPDRPGALPRGAFQATGHGGQRVTVLPEQDLVIVRLGLSLNPGAYDHPALVNAVVKAVADN